VLAYLLTALVSASGADLSSSLKERFGSANTNVARRQPFPDARFILEAGDVVAFLGGRMSRQLSTVAIWRRCSRPGNRGLDLRFRNFGWEGDTVHTRPRDVVFLHSKSTSVARASPSSHSNLAAAKR